MFYLGEYCRSVRCEKFPKSYVTIQRSDASYKLLTVIVTKRIQRRHPRVPHLRELDDDENLRRRQTPPARKFAGVETDDFDKDGLGSNARR